MLRTLMRTLFGLLMAALLLLLPLQPAQAASARQAPARSLGSDVGDTYALALEGVNARIGGEFNPGSLIQQRTCPICANGRVVCPPRSC